MRRYAITSFGNGQRVLILRVFDLASIFLQGDDAIEFCNRLAETNNDYTDDDLCDEYESLFETKGSAA